MDKWWGNEEEEDQSREDIILNRDKQKINFALSQFEQLKRCFILVHYNCVFCGACRLFQLGLKKRFERERERKRKIYLQVEWLSKVCVCLFTGMKMILQVANRKGWSMSRAKENERIKRFIKYFSWCLVKIYAFAKALASSAMKSDEWSQGNDRAKT